MNLLSHSDRKTTRRRPRTFRPEFQATVEGLESRMVLSHAAAAAAVPAELSTLQQNFAQNLLTNLNFAPTGVNVVNGVVSVVGNLTGDLLGHAFTVNNVNIPVSLTPDGNLLHLTLGPVNLNLLGLNVSLDNCNNGPITVDINSSLLSSTLGNALGGLLSDLSGILGGSLTNLSSTSQSLLSGVVGSLLSSLTSTGTGTSGDQGHGNGHAAQGGTCDVLNLHLDQGLKLNVLNGVLGVTTSPICLDVTAVRGPGNVLGNLLCSVAHLLDSNGNPIGGITAHLNQIDRLLGSLLSGV